MQKTDSSAASPAQDPSITGPGTQRATAWSITINNPSDSDLESWKNASALHWVVEAKGQLEQGEAGTRHIQGFLKTQQVRFSQVKKAFPRAHIEVARNPAALAKYVVKEDTRIQVLEQETRVANPKLIQTSLTDKVLEILIHKGNPCIYTRAPDKTWKREVRDWPDGYEPTDRQDRQTTWLITRNKDYLKAHAESLVDEVVESLIESGYMMVEFIMANNQVRTAYKKYLPSICIRNASQTPPSQEDDSSSASSPESPSPAFEDD